MLTAVAVREERGMVKLSELQWNVRQPEAVELVAESMHTIGQVQPVIVDRNGKVMPGKGAKRCEAAHRLGWHKIRVEVCSELAPNL